MRDAYLAVDAATDLRVRAQQLRRSWDACFSGQSAVTQVRTVVAHSWSRMTRAGLDPERLRPRVALDDDGLASVRLASPLRHALPTLRHHLGAIADEAEHVMVLCDADGRILWLEGHPRVLEGARDIAFQPGMSWTERSAGTNAIGTALAIDHPVQIFSAEHFLPEQHVWWCSAAPLHHPVTGDLLGIVDVSGPQRTAHPYSLVLVTAAARIAAAVLREREVEYDNRLRAIYQERIRHAAGTPSALVDGQGRVLVATPHRWVSGTVVPPDGPGGRVLAGGVEVEAERLTPDAWVLWRTDRRAVRRTAPDTLVALTLLGRHGHTVRVGGTEPVGLSLRHAEALALLAMHPDGLTAQQLTLHLYGERGNPVTTRALMSRLRPLLGGSLLARPYRLVGGVSADFIEVETLLAAGAPTRAVARYHGPLLVESEVPRIADARVGLDAAVRRAALDGSAEDLWTWLHTETGREDPEAMRTFVRVADERDPRRDAIAARLRALARD